MGLDTTHDCWHGPYSAFMRWRANLSFHIMRERARTGDAIASEIERMGTTREAIAKAWEKGLYDDQSVPINVLMNHSDCEDDIEAKDCAPLADALEQLLLSIPARADYDSVRPATERFIAGLRRAAARGEKVGFH
jgi:hypothetical protein